MIQNDNTVKAEGSIAEQTSKVFCIQQTKEMMEILSKSMYTNPEKAVARELLCNAYDATVLKAEELLKACKDPNKTVKDFYRPMEVHAPELFEEYFSVRDYGIGLSDEDVQVLYTTYGASTKRDTNSQIGGFGIGSKSPFAISESFNVTSFYKGRKRLYQCYKSKGLPYITKITDEETVEPDGLLVNVPVKYDSTFYIHLRNVLKGFNRADVVMLNQPGDTPFEFFEDYYTFSGVEGLYCVNKSRDHISDYYACVRMGKVIYQTAEAGRDLLIDEPIGTYEIAASREKITQSEETQTAIERRIKELRERYKEHWLKSKPAVVTSFSQQEKLIRDYSSFMGYSPDVDTLKVLGRYGYHSDPVREVWRAKKTKGTVTFSHCSFYPPFTKEKAHRENILFVRLRRDEEADMSLVKRYAAMKKFEHIALYHIHNQPKYTGTAFMTLKFNAYTDYTTIAEEMSQLQKTFDRSKTALRKRNRTHYVKRDVEWRDYYGNRLDDAKVKECVCYINTVGRNRDTEEEELYRTSCISPSKVLLVYRSLKNDIPEGLPNIKEYVKSDEYKKLIRPNELKTIKGMSKIWKGFTSFCVDCQDLDDWLYNSSRRSDDLLRIWGDRRALLNEDLDKIYKRYMRIAKDLEVITNKYRFYRDCSRDVQLQLRSLIIKNIKKYIADKGLDKYFNACY
jgi:hypothetical protein